MMDEDRLFWFPCYPAKLLGALAGMSPHEGYVYWIICLRIYEVNGPCADTIEAIARRAGLSRRQTEQAMELSFQAGRLVRTDGGIMNPFAEKILAKAEEKHQGRKKAGKTGGKISAEKRQSNQVNRPSNASTLLEQNPTQLQLQSEVLFSVENSTPTRKRAGSDDWPEDHVEIFWREYPPFRRSAKKTVASKLATVRKSGLSFATLMAGLRRYVASNPGEFAKGPVVWLNGGCWDDNLPVRGASRPARSGNGFATLLVEHQREQEQFNREEQHHGDFVGGTIIEAEPISDRNGHRR